MEIDVKLPGIRILYGTILVVAAFAAHSAALLECGGLVTGKAAGWRFEASGAKGEDGASF